MQRQPDDAHDDPINAAGRQAIQAATTMAQIAATVARIAAVRAEHRAQQDTATAARSEPAGQAVALARRSYPQPITAITVPTAAPRPPGATAPLVPAPVATETQRARPRR